MGEGGRGGGREREMREVRGKEKGDEREGGGGREELSGIPACNLGGAQQSEGPH